LGPSWAIAFSVVKYAGAAYLIYVGIRRLLTREPSELLAPRDAPLAGLFTQGVVVNVLNPKTALFFLAFLPQFVDPSRTVWTQVLVLGLTFVALGVLTDGLYAVTAGTLARWLKRRRRFLRYASGSVFVGLGVSAALAKRA
jgi:threonine/homoserine/homoserine lactone efflux protein